MANVPAPRWMTDAQVIKHFGLSQNALKTLRSNRSFPQRDPVLRKTDSKAVDAFFDNRSGLAVQSVSIGQMVPDGEENFEAA